MAVIGSGSLPALYPALEHRATGIASEKSELIFRASDRVVVTVAATHPGNGSNRGPGGGNGGYA
jgi:hypothetical protein